MSSTLYGASGHFHRTLALVAGCLSGRGSPSSSSTVGQLCVDGVDQRLPLLRQTFVVGV